MPRGKRVSKSTRGGGKRSRTNNNVSDAVNVDVDFRPESGETEVVQFPQPPPLGINPFDEIFSSFGRSATSQISPPATSPNFSPLPTQVEVPHQPIIQPPATPSPDLAQTSVFSPLGSLVPQKLKEKIWSGGFLDLGILIKSHRQMNEISGGGPVGEVQVRDGKFFVKPCEQESSKLTIDQWTSSFIIYISIFLERFPHRAQELLKYLRDIRLASSRSHTWWQYDEQYRHLQASNPSNNWGVINVELWLLYVSGSPQNPVRLTSPSFTSTQQKVATNRSYNNASPSSLTCNFFNAGRHCRFTNCRYKHACQLCGGNHRRTVCRSNQQ